MSEECIHGFVDGLCATCNPKPVPESASSRARPATRTRSAAAPRATVRSLRAAARVPVGSAPADTVLEQRIYHLTHIRNLPGILTARAIVAATHPVVDLQAAQSREEWGGITIPGTTDVTLGDFVPFFLSPDASLWQSMRAGTAHGSVSREAQDAEAADFMLLVSTVRHVVTSGHAFVVADGNAGGTLTRFATTRDDAERMLHRLRTDGDGASLLDAEFLVAGELPLESVTLIGVGNDKARAAVRDLLAGSDFTPKISVYPPWFLAAE